MDEVLRKHRSLLDVAFAFYATGGVDVDQMDGKNRKINKNEDLHSVKFTATVTSSDDKNNSSLDRDANKTFHEATLAAEKEATATKESNAGAHNISLKVGTKLGVLKRRAKMREATRNKNQSVSKAESVAPKVAAAAVHEAAAATTPEKSEASPGEWPPPGLRMRLDRWMQFLHDAGLCGKGKAPWGRQLSSRDARVAWCLAKRVVVDANGVDVQQPPLYYSRAPCKEMVGDQGVYPVGSAAARSSNDVNESECAARTVDKDAQGCNRHEVRPFASGAYPGNGVGLDRLAFYEALSRCAEMMAKDLPLLPYDLKHHQVKLIMRNFYLHVYQAA